MKAIAKKAHVLFGAALLAAVTLASCGGFFDDASAADSALPAPATTTATTTKPKPKPADNSEPTYYTITIDKNIENGSVIASAKSATPASKAVEGETVTLAASPAEGYALTTLTYTPQGGEATAVEGSGDTRTFKMPAANVTVHATFTPIAYSVTVTDCVGEGSVGLLTSNANAGQRISLVPILNDGWRLDSWNVKDKDGNSITVTDNSFEMPNSDVSVSAVFVKIDYSITILDAENGGVSTENASANYGDTVTLTITPDEGYALATLTYTTRSEPPVDIGGSGGARTFTMPLGDVTVQAAFTPIAYSVVVAQSVTGGRIAASPTNADMNQEISLTAVADTGWKLKAWNVVAEGGAPVTVTNNKFRMPAKNVSVSATFEKINYTVTVLQSANGTLSADKTAAHYGEPVTLTARPADGYALETLVCTPQGGSPEYIEGSGDTRTLSMPAANVTVSATFTPIALSVTVADSITGGRVAASSTNANVGDMITLVPTANTGWQFKAWNVVAEGGAVVTVTENQFTMPAKSVSVSAAFEKIDYSITVEEAENGSARADKTTANYGDTITIDLAAKDGYEFESVSVKDSDGHEVGTSALLDGGKYKFTMPASNVTVTAAFTAINYAVNIGEYERGTVEASATSASVGTSVTLTVKPDTGCKLDALTVKDASGSTLETSASGDKITFAMPAKSVTVSATFVAINYTVSIGCYDHGTVSADKSTANYGDTVTLDFAAKDGYEFESVSVKDSDGHEVGTSALLDGEKYKFTMPASNVTVEATFAWAGVPLTLEAVEAGVKVTFKNMARGPVTYKVNGGTAQTIASETTATITLANEGDKVAFYGDNATYTKDYWNRGNILCDKNCYVYGNVMSLVKSRGFASAVELKGGDTFRELFNGNRCITNKPSAELLLPATTLTDHCYDSMFCGCVNLTSAPELPATTLASGCYACMFAMCENLTSAPTLPATTLAPSCYQRMFDSCRSLTSAPTLPATTLTLDCYNGMFACCENLVSAPTLPATTLASACYACMFENCNNLTSAPSLPATTLMNSCYSEMFSGCKSLTNAPTLPATTLADSCYQRMFEGCRNLTRAPELPVTTLAPSCYAWMFTRCDKLTSAPALPASTLAKSCYYYMFGDCTSLETAPVLPAVTLADNCYTWMFRRCTKLNSVTCLATDISAENCTKDWLSGVASSGTFTKAADIAVGGTNGWQKNSGSGIPEGWTVKDEGWQYPHSITIADNIADGTVTASTASAFVGTSVTLTIRPDDNYKLDTLTVKDADGAAVATNGTDDKITFTMPEKSVIVSATFTAIKYNVNIGAYDHGTVTANTTSATVGTSVTLTIRADDGYKVKSLTVKDANGSTVSTSGSGKKKTFTMPAKNVTVAATFTVVEMIDIPLTIEAVEAGAKVTFSNKAAGPVTYKVNGGEAQTIASKTARTITLGSVGDKVAFYGDNATYYCTSAYLYAYSNIKSDKDCYVYGNIMSLVESEGYESAVELTENNTFYWLFRDSQHIKSKPGTELLLPATKLAYSCYSGMFYGCTSLTSAPALPATTLAEWCYSGMFYGCTSLTSAPALPATTLADYCCNGMFNGCTSLTSAPELPVTTLAKDCYVNMFSGCTSLTSAPELPATTLAKDCYNCMFKGCTSLTSAPALPATTLADYCYDRMFSGCTSLTSAPELPATTLADYCYSKMFDACTSLTSAPELPATTLAKCCYTEMFKGCTSLTSAPELPATTLADDCYYNMFYGCTSLTSVTCLATDIRSGLTGWLYGVASGGTLIRAAGVNWPIASGEYDSGIPESWTVVDYEP